MLTLLTALLIAQGHVHEAGDAATASGTYNAAMAAQPHPLDPDAPKPKGSMTELKIGDQTSRAYVARPKGKPQGALLVIHEYWGLNDWVKDKVEAAGLEWLKKNAQGANVAIIGWCMGGGEALKASLNEPDNVDATIIHYGMPVLDVARLKVLHGPVLGIWANKDRSITPEKVAQFDQALTEAGVKHEFHAYDADHAFANPSGGRYHGEAAKDAWDKTLKFLAANLRK